MDATETREDWADCLPPNEPKNKEGLPLTAKGVLIEHLVRDGARLTLREGERIAAERRREASKPKGDGTDIPFDPSVLGGLFVFAAIVCGAGVLLLKILSR